MSLRARVVHVRVAVVNEMGVSRKKNNVLQREFGLGFGKVMFREKPEHGGELGKSKGQD